VQLGDSAVRLVGAQVVAVNGKQLLGLSLEEVMDAMRDATAPGFCRSLFSHNLASIYK